VEHPPRQPKKVSLKKVELVTQFGLDFNAA
jgi:hypothetical protein